MRIQRTPALKYIGASLAGEREPAETEHRCSHPGTVPLSLEKGGGKASPGCSLSGAVLLPRGSLRIPTRAWGSSSLAPYPCLWSQPCTHAHIMPRGELGKAESCRDPKAVRGSPELPQSALCFQTQTRRGYPILQAGRGIYLSEDDALYPIK